MSSFKDDTFVLERYHFSETTPNCCYPGLLNSYEARNSFVGQVVSINGGAYFITGGAIGWKQGVVLDIMSFE